MITLVSNLIIPLLVLVIVIHGLYKKVDIYDVFVDGSKESFDMILSLFPCLLGMIFGINIFIKSGLLEYCFQFLTPLLEMIKMPIEVVTMAIMRPISGSSTLAILNNIFEASGPDSFTGRLASVIQGSTDTTLYILTLYFGSIGIKKTRYALKAGLFADLIGIIASILVVTIFFG